MALLPSTCNCCCAVASYGCCPLAVVGGSNRVGLCNVLASRERADKRNDTLDTAIRRHTWAIRDWLTHPLVDI